MDTSGNDVNADGTQKKPSWMKTKEGGVKKVSPAEKRRRRNELLRRRLAPKNALMVLNEMFPGESVANNFVVEMAAPAIKGPPEYVAKLSIAGADYRGVGANKMTARNAAAEQVFRDLIIKKLNTASGMVPDANPDDEEIPMMQLASFALHKLFDEWTAQGHIIPNFNKISQGQVSDSEGASAATAVTAAAPAAGPKPKAELPANASSMHPTQLLTHMRPGLEFVDLGVEGDKPQSQTFTLGVTIDNHTYIGKGSSKKEARKNAARTACMELFHVTFDETPAQ